MQNNPSQGVNRDLLPHVHCLSTFRYPIKQQVHPQQIAQWLKEAPEIAQSKAPFFWTYLDRPADGQIFLTWQPLDSLGTGFASDGYIWPPQEQVFQMEVDGGCILEIYTHKSGYGPGEQFTAHARHRYRLLPPRIPTGGPQPDGSLWITHYGAAEPNDRLPSNMIPMNDPRVQHMVSTRNYLQQQGAIIKKEFMLRDSAHWPQIQWPHGNQGPMRGQGYGGPVRTPQTVAYPPHAASASGPPAKRARTNANANNQVPMGAMPPIDMMDDEEETSRGDVFDHMTPREISLARYKQNHRWLEEILNSPYAMHQITPVDLGMGLKGVMAGLTEGIFHSPTGDPDNDPHMYDYVGKLDEGKADEFRKRVNDRIAADNAEMEKMKAKHAKRLAKLKKGGLIVQAEKALRRAAHDPSDVGEEYWRLEGKIDEDENGEKSLPNSSGKVDDIVAQVEASLGRHTAAVQELCRIQDGGFEETVVPSDPPSNQSSRNGSQQSGVMINDVDVDMGGASEAAGLLEQYQIPSFSSTSTPGNNFPTPQPALQAHSSAGTPNVPSPAAPSPAVPAQQVPAPTESSSNAMEGMESSAPAAETSKEGETGEDWVVVPKGGVSPPVDPSPPQPATTAPASASTPAASIPAPTATNPPTAPTSTTNTPSIFNDLDVPDSFSAEIDASGADFGDLGDLDSAGDVLAGFGGDGPSDGNGDMDLGLDMDVDVGMDDSAFGDAFHGVEARGDGEAEGGEGDHGL